MRVMFVGAISFNSDISKWDVSRVADMNRMFYNAKSFNGDISQWDVSRVKNMDAMFYNAASFKQELCGAAWVHSKATKFGTFTGSSGSISRTVCAMTTTQVASDYYYPDAENLLLAREFEAQ